MTAHAGRTVAPIDEFVVASCTGLAGVIGMGEPHRQDGRIAREPCLSPGIRVRQAEDRQRGGRKCRKPDPMLQAHRVTTTSRPITTPPAR